LLGADRWICRSILKALAYRFLELVYQQLAHVGIVGRESRATAR
jgi:hypothetical protein